MTPRRTCLAHAAFAAFVTAAAACAWPLPAAAASTSAVAPAAPAASAPPAAPDKAARASAATPKAAAPAQASVQVEDPMDRLRQRLAERLARGNADVLSGKVELRASAGRDAAVHTVALTSATRPAALAARDGADGAPAAGTAARASTSAATRPLARATGSSSARKTDAAPAAAIGTAGGAGNLPPWGYEGAAGPAAWGGLRAEFALCGNGQRQSPIDIRDGIAVDLEPVRFEYQAGRFAVIDNGATVQVNMAPGSAIEVGGRRYELVEFHFHRPSEERIDGRQFEMSVHLVHKDAQGRLAVVGVLLDKGPAQPVVQTVWNNLPLEKHEEVAARNTLDPSGLLPTDRRYYTYMGSLTTPPCSEGVQWVVMRSPVTMTADQVDIFARLYPMNARPLQAASGRRILQSN